MSMFICGRCDAYRDADDGCDEWGKHGLICADCLDQFPEIRTTHTYPPIPIRSFDWHAFTDDYDGAPDAGPQAVGSGPTRGEAIKDLIENHLEAAQ